MAFIQNFSFASKFLAWEPEVSVLLPSRRLAHSTGKQIWELDGKFKTLYLLHGMGDNHTQWSRMTNVEWFCEKYEIAVVMPAVGVSFYSDMTYGQKYWSYLSIELPRYMRAIFPLSDKREDNFAAGLSMGGYGAYKLALSCPEQFCAAASLSGALDLAGQMAQAKEDPSDSFYSAMINNFGSLNGLKDTPNDLFWLVKRNLQEGRPMPALFQSVGTEDFLYRCNQNFRKFAAEQKVELFYEEGPGVHDWAYWQDRLPEVFRWLSSLGDNPVTCL